MRHVVKTLSMIAVLFLLVGASFGAGLYASGNNLFTACIIRTAEQPQPFAIFWQAWNLVQKNFIDRSMLDPTQLTYGAIRGMVAALGDTGHSGFLTPQEQQNRVANMSGSFTGIGAQMGVQDGLPIFVAPLDGSPAIEAGIKAGDILMRVNDEDVTTLDLNVIVERVRGPAGSTVRITILRPFDQKTYDFTITRREIKVAAATWAMLPGTKIALIRLSQFSENADSDMTNAIQQAKQAGANGLLVDMRNNPGGLLSQAIKVTSQFLKEGDVLLEEDAQGQRTPSPVLPNGIATDLPLVVLVNPGTASSAEIFAGAMQDHQRGQVVGETTFGTGTVLSPYQLDDGSELVLGVRQWLTPKGRLIRKHGIQPDIEVKLPLGSDLLTPNEVKKLTSETLQQSSDAQLLRALTLFKN